VSTQSARLGKVGGQQDEPKQGARMEKPRVSVVHYLNTVPLVWGLLRGEQRGKFELHFTSPARCADAVAEGRAEVGIIPSIELQRVPGLVVIPGVSISSLGAVRSVALFSKKPIESVESIQLDRSSRTSVALLTILLRTFYGISPRMSSAEPDGDAMLGSADAALLIGDAALAYRERDPGEGEPSSGSERQTGGPRRNLKVYDLGAEWKRFTGLPFVYAVWAGPAAGRLVAADFQRSRDYGLAHVDELAAEYGPRHGMAPAAAKIYVTESIDYNLTEEHRKGLRLFHELAHGAGLIPAVEPLRFAS
jgi:chorismate dehydratase